MLRVESVPNGYAVLGSFPEPEVLEFIKSTLPDGKTGLWVCDPPYGNIVADGWDQVGNDDVQFCEWLIAWTQHCAVLSLPQGALYVWGGIGTPRFRPFYRYLVEVERQTPYRLANHITWSKKRAYGVSHNYLFCREEIAYLTLGDIKKPRLFNIPLLETKRGYAGYSAKYPAKSEFYRRTNVWMDVTELLRGKVHTAQKPERLHEIMIETHTQAGEWVLDPFSGSGTTGLAAQKLGRKFILVEKDPESFEKGLQRLRA